MRKFLLLSVLFLLLVLTGSKTLAYWPAGEISSPALFHAPLKEMKIGTWNFSETIEGIIVIPDSGFKGILLRKGELVDWQGNIYYIDRSQSPGWDQDPKDPWNNSLKPYGNLYQKGVYYDVGSFVIKDGHVFQAKHNGVSNVAPNIHISKEQQHDWKNLGSLESLTWRKDQEPLMGVPIYWQGHLYFRNEDFVENIEPGTGPGYNLYNELAFDEYTIYESYLWRHQRQQPVVSYQNKIYTLITETNKVNGRLIKPGEDARIWKVGFIDEVN